MANAQSRTVAISPLGPQAGPEHQHPPLHGANARAAHREVHRTDAEAHAARGPMSPLHGARPEVIIHRDEDVASAQMDKTRKGQIPDVNKNAGVTSIRGAHTPVNYVRSARESQKSGF
jgi:hypothetical protein